MIKNKTK